MRRARFAGLMCLALATLLSIGCSRSYWRRNADAEAYGLIREKTKLDARWAPPRSDVIPSPLSRLYDPADPDYGSLPPDDPYANRYMHAMSDCDRIQGSHYWDKIGMGNSIENPAWVASLPPDTLTGPLLADKIGQQASEEKPSSEPEPLPFAERFALTETLRSWRESLGLKPSAPAGRATVATADVPAKPAASAKNSAKNVATGPPPKAAASTVAKAQRAASAPKVASNVWPASKNAKTPAPQASAPSSNPFDKPTAGDIQLTAFQEVQDDPPLTIPRTLDAEDASPSADDLEPVPHALQVPLPPTEIPDAEEDLSDDPGNPATAQEQPEGPD
ncbi:MAG: hypothetical protein M3552_07630, partial [Planctomycetota bacterium]|nr:hypothetical protein [Planctomycetota bacterium]